MYKYETHLHSKACSACAVSTSFEMVNAALEKGYSGMVFTNHFYHGNTCIDRHLPWEEFLKPYKEDYYAAKEYGESKGIKVFFGIEEGYAPGKEMLIYGISPETLANYPIFNKADIKDKVDFIHKNGGITICAHPFRDRSYIPNPDKEPDMDLFDGIEVFNYFNRQEDNEKAVHFAKKNKIISTSGGDVHHAKDFGNAGIAFDQPAQTIEEFIKNIITANFKMIINGEIV